VLYTDGVLEHGTARGDPFGVARLRQWIEDWREGPAAEAVKDLLARLRSVGGPEPFEDDVTVVLVRRPLVSG
jgi:serine phosphatase RsbU (regulator of sigma subunit)